MMDVATRKNELERPSLNAFQNLKILASGLKIISVATLAVLWQSKQLI